jgi:anti-sigma regulatory factor (Ser/Thr protein kinase)
VQTIFNSRVLATPMSLPTLRHATREALVGAGVGCSLFDESIAVALSEAVGNAVRHAYPDIAGEIDLAVILDDLGILVIVSDSGVGVDHPSAQPGLGLGLNLIGQLSTTCKIDSTSAGTTVIMRFALSDRLP